MNRFYSVPNPDPLPEGSQPGRILVLRSGAIGDVVVSFPVLAFLRERFPRWKITFAGRTEAKELAVAAGLADEAADISSVLFAPLFSSRVTACRESEELLSFLKPFKIIVSLLKDKEGTLSRKLQDPSGAKVFLLKKERQDRHVAEDLLSAVEDLGSRSFSLRRKLICFEESSPSDFNFEKLPTSSFSPDRPFAVFHVGSGSPKKNWPAENYIELGKALISSGIKVVLPEGEADTEVVSEVRKGLGDSCTLVRVNLIELAKIISSCLFYVGNDSGVSHIAGLCGVHTVAIFGPTDPFRWRPLGPKVYPVRGKSTLFPSLEEVIKVGHLEKFLKR